MSQEEQSLGAQAILEQAADSLRAIRTVRYGFTYGDIDEPTGYVTGTTWMKHNSTLEDAWIRVEGTVQAQPDLGVESERFVYATNGEQAWSTGAEGAVDIASVEAGGNTLSSRGVYGFLPEFAEDSPFWRELSLGTEFELREREEVGGVECDVVRVVIPLDGGDSSEVIWSVGVEDRLPRRGRWISAMNAPNGVTFDLSNLEPEIALEESLFLPPQDEGETDGSDSPATTVVAVGETVPPWALTQPDGTEARSSELLGSVVVLDFWNTWCPICRSIAPATHELARELASERVRFFGVNLLETGEPVAYWNSVNPPYPTLLEGDELAQRLDLPWQPGIAVIGADGTLLHKQFGASADRVERLREAVKRGLREIEGTSD